MESKNQILLNKVGQLQYFHRIWNCLIRVREKVSPVKIGLPLTEPD